MTKEQLQKQLDELKDMIQKLPTKEKCMKASQEIMNEENYAFAYGYLNAAVERLKKATK